MVPQPKGDSHRCGVCFSVFTIAARKSGDQFKTLYGSNGLTNDIRRGFGESQIAFHDNRLYMTMRTENGFGYVTPSDDAGRSRRKAQPWIWDYGSRVSMHSTMTNLLSHSHGLALVYTRIRDDNAEVFRNRAPLLCTDADPISRGHFIRDPPACIGSRGHRICCVLPSLSPRKATTA